MGGLIHVSIRCRKEKDWGRVGLTFIYFWWLPGQVVFRCDGYLSANLGDALEDAAPCLPRGPKEGLDGLACSATYPTQPHGVLPSKYYPTVHDSAWSWSEPTRSPAAEYASASGSCR
jgi:hypothetical protein